MACPHCLSTSISKRKHRTCLDTGLLLPRLPAAVQRTAISDTIARSCQVEYFGIFDSGAPKRSATGMILV
jgi:hypothetical protein